MKTKSKKKTIILCVVLAVVIALLTPVAVWATQFVIEATKKENAASYYTEEQHLKRISELVEKHHENGGFYYTSYELFPLYDQNEEMHYCIVEFKPYGFVWIKINERNLNYKGLNGMYTRCEVDGWSRYEYIDTTQTSSSEDNIKWETDEAGERIYYKDSPYKVAGITDERRYVVTIIQANYYHSTIPAVKRGDKYLNLMDMKEFEYVPESETFVYPYFSMSVPPKHHFDL